MKRSIAILLLVAACSFAQTATPKAPETPKLIKISSMSPKSPATLKLGERFTIKLHYKNPGKNVVLVYARPQVLGTSSPIPQAKSKAGFVEYWFYFDKPTVVDELELKMVDQTENKVLATEKVPVKLTWK